MKEVANNPNKKEQSPIAEIIINTFLLEFKDLYILYTYTYTALAVKHFLKPSISKIIYCICKELVYI